MITFTTTDIYNQLRLSNAESDLKHWRDTLMRLSLLGRCDNLKGLSLLGRCDDLMRLSLLGRCDNLHATVSCRTL